MFKCSKNHKLTPFDPLPPPRRHRCTTTPLIATSNDDELLWVCYNSLCVSVRTRARVSVN